MRESARFLVFGAELMVIMMMMHDCVVKFKPYGSYITWFWQSPRTHYSECRLVWSICLSCLCCRSTPPHTHTHKQQQTNKTKQTKKICFLMSNDKDLFRGYIKHYAAVNGTFYLSTHENILTIALLNIYYYLYNNLFLYWTIDVCMNYRCTIM